MAHFVSQPLAQYYAQYHPQEHTFPLTARQDGVLSALPDPYDPRYPRPLRQRALRLAAGVWWLPLVVYASQATAMVSWQMLIGDYTFLTDEHPVARALRLDWLPALVTTQPEGLVAVALGVMLLLGWLIGGFFVGRWAAEDRRQEARVLVLRLARPEERLDSRWMQRALAPALEWQMRKMRWRWRVTALLLTLAAVGGGVLLGLSGVVGG